MSTWQTEALKAKTTLQSSIPTQWLLPEDKLPPSDQKNVADFPRASGLLTDRELSITEMSATALVAGMGAGRFSAEEVVVAFLKRAVLGHQLLNFATEFMADKAIARAKELDAYYRRTGKLVGPLHGVPISVKEHIGIKGLTCNGGYVAWVNDIAPEDALILQCLHKAGAIFHVRTNQPQSLMHLCCSNNLTGTTTNPYNRTLTPGGSSGGEGASMGFKCAPLGAPEPGQEAILGVVGPLAAQSLDDLELFQRVVLDAEPWDVETSLVPLPWRRVKENREFTVGIMWDDGTVRPHPPIIRALKAARSKLQAAGIKVVDWDPYKHAHGWDIISKLYFPDTASSQKTLLSQTNEPILPLTEWAFSYAHPTPLSIAEAWALNVARDEYRDEYHARMKAMDVDFILCPAYVGVAPDLYEAQYWNYTAVWNVLDLPAVVFPSGMAVEEGDVGGKEGWVARNEVEEREWRKWWVDPGRFVGAPVGLQMVGGHFKDEETIAAAKVVEEVVRGSEGGRARL
ncbi:glutamyl-tRNA(gln) amidotransferase subunit A [Aspergillus nomiae NRRL 13137]|uniref:Glutamyl-tRNA(Gln) amidotransferase subunit A n=1 Tax=Aspergillus nomiae NRRL (strain ATCC 15546 / NRRL 13137 / CBS 260.88 / M93) TaxID=1509407 RepID=A0A0L1IVB5_ASPN3|nr:glutamyl-tRNA(gln) amidotransferase subunit A [Aspergillus nomiae NRRL 13137]KNG83128.1 glutamyl-tRNA(gln) amidotransferase subunit A [Aspergillus nomiae NRRL 13137]